MMKIIARIYNDYSEKFGIPRQSGLVSEVESRIVFEPEYRVTEAIRGLEQFDYLWIIWQFSETIQEEWKPTVRPPRLGGNKRMGVFATRSPFRPNPIGLSSVKIIRIEYGTEEGDVIIVSGADIMNSTPVYDIKPYLPYADSHPDASDGFALNVKGPLAEVIIPEEIRTVLGKSKAESIASVLGQNPVPQYKNDPEKIYGMKFAGYDISFVSDGKTVRVTQVKRI